MAGSTRERVIQLCTALARNDVDRAADFIHDDIDWLIYGPVHVFPFFGQRRGKEQVLQVIRDISSVFTLESYKAEVIIVEGDRAAVVSDVARRQTATGRLLRFRAANFFLFQGEKVIEFRLLANTFDLAEQALGRWLDVGQGATTSPQPPL